MDAARFDALVCAFGAHLPRRALSGLFAAVLITVGVVEAETKNRSNPKHRNHHKRGRGARANRVHDDGRKKKKKKKKGKGGRAGSVPTGGGGGGGGGGTGSCDAAAFEQCFAPWDAEWNASLAICTEACADVAAPTCEPCLQEALAEVATPFFFCLEQTCTFHSVAAVAAEAQAPLKQCYPDDLSKCVRGMLASLIAKQLGIVALPIPLLPKVLLGSVTNGPFVYQMYKCNVAFGCPLTSGTYCARRREFFELNEGWCCPYCHEYDATNQQCKPLCAADEFCNQSNRCETKHCNVCGDYVVGSKLPCGELVNNCGQTITCTCPSTANVCRVDPPLAYRTCCDPRICSPAGLHTPAMCGTWDDGCGDTINCGNCARDEICVNRFCERFCPPNSVRARGATDECCVPKTCAELGKSCGAWDDGCEGTVDCGDCADPCDGAPCGVVGTVTQTRTGDFSQPINGNPDSPIMTTDFDSTITWRVDQTGQMFVDGGWTSNTYVDGTCCAPPNAPECSWVPYQDWSKVREAYSGPYDGKLLTQLGTLQSRVNGSATRYRETQQNAVCGSGEHFEYEVSAQVMDLVPFDLGEMRPDYSWAGSSTGSQPHPSGQAYHLEQTWDLRLVTLP